MLKLSRSGVALVSLSTLCLLGGSACSRGINSDSSTKAVVPVPAASSAVSAPVQPASTTKPSTAQPVVASTKSDPYKLALDKAEGAKIITESAQSQDDWKLVVGRWQQAIKLMQLVPSSSPYRALAKSKLAEYQRSLAYAKKQVTRTDSSEIALELPSLSLPVTAYNTPTTQSAKAAAASSSQADRVYRARIKRREGGTPVIDVTFNGRQSFEMIVDTGASGTVITEQMAVALGLQVIGKAKVDTASERGVEVPLALVNSISVGGAAIKGVVVAIGGSALDIGLLGHDFFGDFDVTVKRDVVEFRSR